MEEEKQKRLEEEEQKKLEEEKQRKLDEEKKLEEEKKKEENEKEYRNNSVSYSYEEISRYPNKFLNEKVTYTGKVLQIFSPTEFIININRYDRKEIHVKNLNKNYMLDSNDPRILEGDIITVYGNFLGISRMYNIPYIGAYYIDINQKR